MTIPVTICDDSSFARKQLVRAFPENWDIDLTFATNGEEGLEAVRQNKAEEMFLDLTLPGIGGYEVLEVISAEKLDSLVIVVSADIQPEAHARVMKMGAIEFLKKPSDASQIQEILNKFGLISEALEKQNQVRIAADNTEVSLSNVYQEIANIAMGQTSDLLTRYFDVFFVLPIPSVNPVEVTELQMMLQSIDESRGTSAVFQGFIGNDIAGEL
jgi:DNA-binding NtrC family response regulator